MRTTFVQWRRRYRGRSAGRYRYVLQLDRDAATAGPAPGGRQLRVDQATRSHARDSTEHLDANIARAAALRAAHRPQPLEEILVVGSTYHRGHLKQRCTPRASSGRCASSADRTTHGADGGCPSSSTTPTATPPTTGSRTSGCCAPTAPRRSTRTAAGRVAVCAPSEPASLAARSSTRATRVRR